MLTDLFGELDIKEDERGSMDLSDIGEALLEERNDKFAVQQTVCSTANNLEPGCPLSSEINSLRLNENKEQSFFHINDEKMPRLQKASSVPAINSGTTTTRKKTSDANPLLDPILQSNLMQENQILRDNLVKLKEKNKEIISINHDWDKSYNTLAQQHAEFQTHFQRTCEQLNYEISKKEEEKERVKAKLEHFINEGCLDENSLLAEEKEEKNKILKREQVALQNVKEFQMKCQHMDHLLRQSNEQKSHLERELQRLSLCMEKHPLQNFAGASDPMAQKQPNLDNDVDKIDLLRQQLQTYVEDFDAEKNDKHRILKENEEIKRKLTVMVDENEHLKTQLQIYEKDFSREREKRIQLMRKSNHVSRSVMPPSFNNNAVQHEDMQKKWQQFNGITNEREQVERTNYIDENLNLNPWSHGYLDNNMSRRVPPYPHQQSYQ